MFRPWKREAWTETGFDRSQRCGPGTRIRERAILKVGVASKNSCCSAEDSEDLQRAGEPRGSSLTASGNDGPTQTLRTSALMSAVGVRTDSLRSACSFESDPERTSCPNQNRTATASRTARGSAGFLQNPTTEGPLGPLDQRSAYGCLGRCFPARRTNSSKLSMRSACRRTSVCSSSASLTARSSDIPRVVRTST